MQSKRLEGVSFYREIDFFRYRTIVTLLLLLNLIE